MGFHFCMTGSKDGCVGEEEKENWRKKREIERELTVNIGFKFICKKIMVVFSFYNLELKKKMRKIFMNVFR